MSDSSLALLEDLAFANAARVREPVELVREIVATDIPLVLQELREHNWTKGAQNQNVAQVLRTSHHKLAQLLAGGVPDAEASFITGRSTGSISSLRSDPAFRELLSYYEAQQEGRDTNVYDRLTTLGVTAMEILQQRLEESSEKLTNADLTKIMDSAFDRSVAPAKGGPRAGAPQSGLNVQINFVKSSSNGVPSASQNAIEAEIIEEK